MKVGFEDVKIQRKAFAGLKTCYAPKAASASKPMAVPKAVSGGRSG